MTEDLSASTLAHLKALEIVPGRPLIAVDVDEVLVKFVSHLSDWMRGIGFEMRLVTYQLEGSMFPAGSEEPLPFAECIELINRFFSEETENQQAIPGGREALLRLEVDAQIVILTNVPGHATEMRRRNLDALGLHYPLVVNSGGKGRAVRWLADNAGAPVAMIDDSTSQLSSVAKWVPESCRIHFAWADFIDRIFPDCEHATARARSWDEAADILAGQLFDA